MGTLPRIFSCKDKWTGCVLLNWSGMPVRDLEHVTQAYRTTARTALENLRGKRDRTLTAGDEFIAYPIIFLYRHALELVLKVGAREAAPLLEHMGKPSIDQRHLGKHALRPLYEHAQVILAVLGYDPLVSVGNSQVAWVDLITEIDDLDPLSFTFRYTVNKDWTNASLGNAPLDFDLFRYGDIMDLALEDVRYIPDAVDAEWESRRPL